MKHNIHKIAVVIPKYGLVGGAEHFVSELTRRLSLNPRYDIHVFTNKWLANGDQIIFHKIPIIAFPKFLTTISFSCFAKNKMAKVGIDLIHAHDRIFDADIFTMHGVPHAFWIHQIRRKDMNLNDLAMAWIEKKLARNPRCKRFISVSKLASEKFLQAYDVDAKKVQVIHPGIDMERFRGLDRGQCRHEIRSLWSIDETDIVILFVSMNFDIKGLDALMAAMAKAKSNDRCQKIKLLIVGKGEEKKYGQIGKNLGIGNDIIFAGIHREKLERIYLACDIFSILSKFDTFGIAVLEAMAASLPVVISGNVGAKDLVAHGVNGFIIEDNTDMDKISEKICILMNREVRTRMGLAAHETAMNNTWESVAKKYECIYDELLERNS